MPKKCGHTPSRRVIPLAEMLKKIEVAVESRRSDDTLLIARTDSRTSLGLDEAIKRGQAFAKAGADIVFVESPESAEEFRRIGGEIDGWRSEERRVGKECVRTCRSRWSPSH